MTEAELAATWREFKATGDVALRNALVVEYLPFVRRIAWKLFRRLPRSVQVDDLVSAGVFGLMDAIKDFNLDRGVKFETFSMSCIHWAMIDDLRAFEWVGRYQLEKAKRSEEPLVRVESFGEDIGRFDDPGRVDSAGELMRKELPGFVRKRLGCLSQKRRRFMSWYYVDGLSQREIGARLGVTESQVSHLHSQIKSYLKGEDKRLPNQCVDRERRGSCGVKMSGLPVGVFPSRTKFVAKAKLHGRLKYLGTFPTVHEASLAYQRAVGGS